MKRRVVIPTEDAEGTTVAEHFGRSPYYITIDLNEDGSLSNRTIHPNTGGHMGGTGHAHDNVMNLLPNVVIVQGMGPRGITGFQSHGVAVLKANSQSVEQVLSAYVSGSLSELTEGCADAHHR